MCSSEATSLSGRMRKAVVCGFQAYQVCNTPPIVYYDCEEMDSKCSVSQNMECSMEKDLDLCIIDPWCVFYTISILFLNMLIALFSVLVPRSSSVLCVVTKESIKCTQ